MELLFFRWRRLSKGMLQRGVARSRHEVGLCTMLGTSKPERDGWAQKHSVIQVSLFDPGKSLPNFKNFSSFFFHSSFFFASVIQLLLFVRSHFSLPFLSCGFKNSLSSSHLLLGLPTGLRVLILLSCPGCQSKIFFCPPFLW